MNELFTDPIGAKLVNAFCGPRSLWRTPGGIARQTGLSPEQVQTYIQAHQDLFIRSPLTPGGIPLYGLRRDLRTRFQERESRVISRTAPRTA